jgi:hypothetical protein
MTEFEAAARMQLGVLPIRATPYSPRASSSCGLNSPRTGCWSEATRSRRPLATGAACLEPQVDRPDQGELPTASADYVSMAAPHFSARRVARPSALASPAAS